MPVTIYEPTLRNIPSEWKSEPDGSLPCQQEPGICAYTKQQESSPHPNTHPISLKSSVYYAPIYYYIFQVVSFLQVSPPEACKHLPSLPNVPHAQSSSTITHTISGEKYRSRSSSLCSFLNAYATSTLLGPNSFCSTLLSNTLYICSNFNMTVQFSLPYKTTSKIILLYI